MYFIGDVFGRLRDRTGVPVLCQEIPTSVDPAPAPPTPDNHAKVSTSSDNDSEVDEATNTIVYIGEESLTLTHLPMTYSSSHESLVG